MRPPRLLGVLALLLVALATALVAVPWWALRSDGGTAWLLRHVPGLRVAEPRGALLGGDFSARRLEWRGADGLELSIEGLSWRGLAVARSAMVRTWLQVSLDELSAARVTVKPAGGDGGPPRPAPTDLRLPVAIDVARLRVGELRVGGPAATPLVDVQARLRLGSDEGAWHRIDELSLRRERVGLRGALQVGTEAPLGTEARVELGSLEGAPLPWRAELHARGPLAQLRVDATLRAGAGGDTAALDAVALVRPFEAWPLPELDASTRALDLSLLADGLPVTALDGRARIEADGWSRPARVAIDLANTKPGRLNEGRVPVARLRIDGAARPDRPERFDADTLAVEFAQGGGRLEGRGSIDRDTVTLDARVIALRADRLDARLAALALDGPLKARLDGLGARNRLELQAQLAGRVGASRPVALKLDVAGDRDGGRERIDLRELLAQAGDARARLAGRAERDPADRGWSLTADARLERFDPLPFWSGREDSPWRRGPHRVNATATAALRLVPPRTAGLDAWIGALRGDASLALADSVLAGVPVSGDVALAARDAGLSPKGSLTAGGNRIAFDGTLARGGADRWNARVDAPALATLEPIARLLRPAGAAAPGLAGALDAQLRVDGRWPRIASEGRASLKQARWADLSAGDVQARWTIGAPALAARDAPLEVQLDATDLRLARERPIDSAGLRTSGTLADHRIELRATSPVRPPEWVDRVAGIATGRATVAQLLARGHVNDTRDAWRGTVALLQLGAAEGETAARTPWLRARDLALAVSIDRASGALASASAEPGRLELLGTALKWNRLAWNASPRRLSVQAELEPLAVAPWLQRLQPEFGWSGDLAVGGRIDIDSAAGFAADVVIERRSGDLVIRDPVLADVPPQPLGLTDLRLALNARDGTWYFTQALAGNTLGVAAGAVSLRTDPAALWPDAATPIQGVLEVQVAKLGAWGTWLPAAWRLSGMLNASAQIGGRFGAPEYTGRLSGRGIGVRNVLEGVNVTDGELDVALQGPSARIERAVARAGAGSVRVEGGATFGAGPRAQLRLVADRFQLLGRVDRRIVASGDAAMQLDADTVKLDGRFKVDEGLVDFTRGDAPGLSDDVQVVRPGRPERPAPDADAQAARRARPVSLDLTVDLGDALRLRGRGLDTRLAGQLRLTAPGGRLAVNGSVRAVDGQYAAYGQKLEIERGVIVFNGPAENPRLDILAIRPNLDVRVGVAVGGTAQSPRIRLTSEPEMSDTDKLSWLVLGRGPDGLGRTDTALLQRAALALLAGEGEAPTDQITGLIGLDELSVRQSDGEVRETIISLGKQLSRRWYVGYERSLNATTGNWQLIYRVAQRFTLRAQSGLDNSLDLIWTWRWN